MGVWGAARGPGRLARNQLTLHNLLKGIYIYRALILKGYIYIYRALIPSFPTIWLQNSGMRENLFSNNHVTIEVNCITRT